MANKDIVADSVFDQAIEVRIKPLEWKSGGEDDYTLYSCDTPYGRFVYGTDRTGVSYHQSPSDEVDHASEAAAKQAAEESYAALALEKIGQVTVPGIKSAGEKRTFSFVGELRAVLAKYADDCVEARYYGGPTIYPRSPFNEDFARKYATELKGLETWLSERK